MQRGRRDSGRPTRIGVFERAVKEPFHPGEIAVQERVGARAGARKIGGGIRPEIATRANSFLTEREMAVVAGVDGHGAVWASLLIGPRGFLEAVGADRLRVRALPAPGDPLEGALRDGAALGLLAIDFETRRRMRLNGTVALRPHGFDLVPREVFANCPKYIQARVPDGPTSTPKEPPTVVRQRVLGADQHRWIAEADTFFVASVHPQAGADASHRGGAPGFVRLVDGGRIAWPDYAGNRMFQTLGNLHVDGRAGLLFLDFQRGDTLQLTGRATIDWNPARAAALPGAERIVDFAIADVAETRGRGAPRLRLLEPSPFNPR